MDVPLIVQHLHASGRQVAAAITGGGSGAIASWLQVPGGSRLIVEAIVPYSLKALTDYLGFILHHAAGTETALAMARRAHQRAAAIAEDGQQPVGLGATASLVSDRPKKGDHRCHIATVTDADSELCSIVLEKGQRDRAAEEELVARAIVLCLARACSVTAPPVTSLLSPKDQCTISTSPSSNLLSRLIAGELDRVSVLADGQLSDRVAIPPAVLPGSFRPLHVGHIQLARVASDILKVPVIFEISVLNVDKPTLGGAEIRRRIGQFGWWAQVELTRAPTFREKSRLLPGTTFVVGADTAERIVALQYYGDDPDEMNRAIEEIAANQCRFLVAGRIDVAGRVRRLEDIAIPARHAHLFSSIPEQLFRVDVSSTEIRTRRRG